MADFRIHLAHQRGNQRMLIRAQVWAPEWSSERLPADERMKKEAEPARYDWYTADEWSIDAPRQLTAKAIREICADRGWEVVGDRGTDGAAVIVPVQPGEWARVLRAAVDHRAATRKAWEAAESAWMGVVAAAPSQGEPGYVSAIDIAEMAEVTRFRVYQIQNRVASKPDLATPDKHPADRKKADRQKPAK